MTEMELRNAYEFNRDKALREDVMSCRDMFGGMKHEVNVERESLLELLLGANRKFIF